MTTAFFSQANPPEPGLEGAPHDAPHRFVEALLQGRLGDPFTLLGPHRVQQQWVIRTFQPGARSVDVIAEDGTPLAQLDLINPAGLFGVVIDSVQADQPMPAYRLRIVWPGATPAQDSVQETADPYAFGLLLGELDIYLLKEGRHRQLGHCLGAQPMTIDGVAGTRFAVWAPNARRVSVIGDFNHWDGRRHPMRLRQDAGVWELFIPQISPGEHYKYELIGVNGEVLPHKADPVARMTELPPGTASIVAAAEDFNWTDDEWMAARAQRQAVDAPLSIYEVHAGSWLRNMEQGGRSLRWEELAERLIPYAVEMGFTHLEFMPLAEYPFGGSWGYQPLAQFAPTARFGTPAAFADFVDRCHAAGLGVIVDWVPAHFPSDAHGLAHFDGTALYEHADPREGFHQDWNTLIYNFGRNEVRGFMVAAALEWLQRFHVDGLRVDAVASMLYRDYSRKAGEWLPNIHGGRENLEAVAFLREMNQAVAEHCPGAITLAEESTSWPGVSAPVADGGLGFHYKWNMGWMHDTLRYIEHDPLHRSYHHHDFTFGLIYAFSEKFVLPISHDEVVYGKGSLLTKMPGDDWQQRANLRAYFGFMFTHPGKKLLFMGCEFGQPTEWNHDGSLTWDLLDDPRHRGIQRVVRDLNRLYSNQPALHASDTHADGFAWVVGEDRANSVFAYLRKHGDAVLLVVCNMTPVVRHDYRIGVPQGGIWRELLNTDAADYGGSGVGNSGAVGAQPQPAHGCGQSLLLTLPPLATLVLGQVGGG